MARWYGGVRRERGAVTEGAGGAGDGERSRACHCSGGCGVGLDRRHMRAPLAPPAEPVRGPAPGPSPSVVPGAQAGGLGPCWQVGTGRAGFGREGSVCWGGRDALRPHCGGLGRGQGGSGVILRDGRTGSREKVEADHWETSVVHPQRLERDGSGGHPLTQGTQSGPREDTEEVALAAVEEGVTQLLRRHTSSLTRFLCPPESWLY